MNAPATPGPRAPAAVFTALVLAAFALVVALGLWHHELWRDEWRHWLFARRSASPGELLGHLRLHGHPPLWNLGLMYLSRLWPRVEAMQLYHLAWAALNAFLVLRFAPLPRWACVLFVAGYFPLYEYGVISRVYVLGLSGYLVACALFPRRAQYWPWLVAALVLAGQTGLHALVLADGLGAVLVLDLFLTARGQPTVSPLRRWAPPALSLLALALGSAVSLWQMIPPPALLAATPDWRPDGPRLLAVLGLAWRGWVPLPRPELAFWNTNLVPWPWLQALLGLGLLAAFVQLCRRSWMALGVVLLPLLGLMGFHYGFYHSVPDSLRHDGYLWYALLAAVWVARCGPAVNAPTLAAPPRWGVRLGATLLAAHVLAGAWALGLDWARPFTTGQAAAAAIRASPHAAAPVLVDWYPQGDTLAGYLDRPVGFARLHAVGYFYEEGARAASLSVGALVRLAGEAATRRGGPVLLAFSYPVADKLPQRDAPALHLLYAGPPAIVADEQFSVYVVAPWAP